MRIAQSFEYLDLICDFEMNKESGRLKFCGFAFQIVEIYTKYTWNQHLKWLVGSIHRIYLGNSPKSILTEKFGFIFVIYFSFSPTQSNSKKYPKSFFLTLFSRSFKILEYSQPLLQRLIVTPLCQEKTKRKIWKQQQPVRKIRFAIVLSHRLPANTQRKLYMYENFSL